MQHITHGRAMPDQRVSNLAMQLDAHILRVFHAAAGELECQGIPPKLIGQSMLRLAMQIVHTTEGPKQLRESTAALLDIFTQPRD